MAPLRPMDGVRVLEIGTRLGVASAGLALTALGADVVQVRGERRTLGRVEHTYYDRGRTVLDAATRDLASLASAADVIVTDAADDELLARGVPVDETHMRTGPHAQVLVTVRSFGRSGPYRDFHTTDLIEWASTGLATVTRRPHPPSSPQYTPVLPPESQPQALAGLAAASAAVLGRRWALRRREPVIADVSVQEVVAALLHGIYPTFVWNNIVVGRPSTAATALGMLLPASDGDVYIRTLDPRQWDALVEWVGDDTVAALGASPDARLANNDALVLLLGEWTVTQRRDDLVVEGQRRRVPIALPRTVDDVLAWQHLRARGAWTSIDLDGGSVEAPRIPLLEPTAWPKTRSASVDDVVAKWKRAS